MGSDVLVVDDNMTNALAVSTMLGKMGFHVDEASSGVEAINLSCHKNYRLILMDYLMPDMDGIQTIKQIKFIMRGEECPVFIGLSATLEEEVAATFGEAGVTYLLEKPVRMEKLREILDEIGISVQGSGREERTDQMNLENLFLDLEEVDYEKGIDLMAGSLDNYMNVLKACVKNITDNYMALDSVRDTGQMESFSLYFHSLKGVFLNIGADGLVEESVELETAAKERRLDDILGCLDLFLERIKRFTEKIQRVYDKYASYKSESAGDVAISDSEFARQLSDLKQHIEDFEYIEITELLEQMLAGCHDGKRDGLDQISEAIQKFDYDLALEIVKRLE